MKTVGRRVMDYSDNNVVNFWNILSIDISLKYLDCRKL